LSVGVVVFFIACQARVEVAQLVFGYVATAAAVAFGSLDWLIDWLIG
jgi:hypothetical protein